MPTLDLSELNIVISVLGMSDPTSRVLPVLRAC